MGTQVFINLPVADLRKSVAFYEALGYTRNPQFSNDDGACIVVSDTIFLMLLTHAKFRVFTPKAICDTDKAVEVLLNLSCDTAAQVELARWMFSHGYEAEGLQWSKKILVDSPGLPEVCQLLADYHRSRGREDLASSYLAQKRDNARDPGHSTRRKP